MVNERAFYCGQLCRISHRTDGAIGGRSVLASVVDQRKDQKLCLWCGSEVRPPAQQRQTIRYAVRKAA